MHALARIDVCGDLAVTVGGERREMALRPQSRMLLAYLALNRARPVSRDELELAVWGEETTGDHRASLNSLLSKARGVLPDDAIESTSRASVQLADQIGVDYHDALRALQEADDALHRTPPALDEACARAEQALRLAGRGLLHGETASWLEEPRRQLSETGLRARECLAEAALVQRPPQVQTAVDRAREIVKAEPYRESAYALLMRSLKAQGNVAEALTAYEQLRTRLSDELGVPPGPSLRGMHEQLLNSADAAAPAPGPSPFSAPPVMLPPAIARSSTDFVGRAPELEILPESLQLPSGTVTFLLSDIEGSTRLWESFPDAMTVAVPRHYELIAAAVERRGGVRPVEQGEGDSVVAAFARASDALQAALDAQRALCAEGWPEGVELRVRVALHTAEDAPRDAGVYQGVALSRCARLRAVAQGGQTLLSRTTRELVADRLPEGVELVDLGSQRLRDLGRPEQVFCLTHPDLPRDFALLRAVDGPPNKLPRHWTSFIGRQRELDETRQELHASRLLTLTGVGGCGKTRLAVEAAADALERFPDGVWWVELGPITDPELIGPALAQALGVRSLPGQSDLDAAVAYLHERRALVVLDNCEHLLDHAASAARALLHGCDELTLLATSRAPLNISGETDWRVPSLSLPTEDAASPGEELACSDAARLFVERARKVRPHFRVTDDNAPAIAGICRELDGIPLAIELAAARVRLLSVSQIADGLSDRFRLLTGGERTALPRQQTLRASVDWSHQLLTDGERTLLRRLAVFAGGFSFDAAEDVCPGDELAREQVLDLLGSLVEKSLVQTEDRGSSMRYRMLETVRQFALERLVEAGELELARNRHRDAFLEFAERIAPELLTPRQTEWLDQLDVDAANLAAAVDRATCSDPQKALRLCAALTLWWNVRGQYASAETGFRGALEAAERTPSSLRARVLWGRAMLLTYAGEYKSAIHTAQQGLAEAEEVGDESTAARVLQVIGTIQAFPDPRGSRAGVERGRELASASGDEWALALCNHVLAFSHLFQENREKALPLLEEAFPVFERLGYHESLAFHWIGLALAHYALGEHERCREFAERASVAARNVGEPNSEGIANGLIALTEIDAGAGDEALERAMAGRERAVARGAGLALPWIELSVGVAHAARGALEDAVSTLEPIVEVGANGVLHALAWAEVALAEVLRLSGDRNGAAAHAQRVLELMNHLDNPWFGARARHVVGRLAAARSSWGEAERLHHEALEAIMDRGFDLELPGVIEGLAEVAHGLESDEEAARILGAAERVRGELGFAGWNHQREEVEVLTERVRDALGNPDFDAAFQQGTELAPGEVVAWLRRARGSRKRPSGGWESLTPTELQVTHHAAQGLTNSETGARMFISRGTVKVHLSHIYAKLGIRNRAELTREAARRFSA